MQLSQSSSLAGGSQGASSSHVIQPFSQLIFPSPPHTTPSLPFLLNSEMHMKIKYEAIWQGLFGMIEQMQKCMFWASIGQSLFKISALWKESKVEFVTFSRSFLLQCRTSDILQYLSTKFSVCRAQNVCTSKIPISAKFPDILHPNHLGDLNFDSLIYAEANAI